MIEACPERQLLPLFVAPASRRPHRPLSARGSSRWSRALAESSSRKCRTRHHRGCLHVAVRHNHCSCRARNEAAAAVAVDCRCPLPTPTGRSSCRGLVSLTISYDHGRYTTTISKYGIFKHVRSRCEIVANQLEQSRGRAFCRGACCCTASAGCSAAPANSACAHAPIPPLRLTPAPPQTGLERPWRQTRPQRGRRRRPATSLRSTLTTP